MPPPASCSRRPPGCSARCSCAPEEHGFELGQKTQVVARETKFALRARQLHALYARYDELDAIPARVREPIEQSWFGGSFRQRAAELRGASDGARAEAGSKQEMAQVFRSYLARAARAAVEGDLALRADFLVRATPAQGALRAALAARGRGDWREVHAEDVAFALLDREEAAPRIEAVAGAAP